MVAVGVAVGVVVGVVVGVAVGVGVAVVVGVEVAVAVGVEVAVGVVVSMTIEKDIDVPLAVIMELDPNYRDCEHSGASVPVACKDEKLVAARKSDNEVLDKAMKYRAEIDEEFILNEHYVEGRQDGFFDGYQQAEKDLGVEKK